MGEVLAHPASVTGGVWSGQVQVVTLPLPPQRPQMEMAHFPSLVAHVGADAAVCLLQLIARVGFDPRLGWHVRAATSSVAQWNCWGMARTRTALRALESAKLIRRGQSLETNPSGGSRRGSGVMSVLPNAEPTLPTVLPLPSPDPSPRTWGPPLPEETLVAVLEEMEFDNPASAVASHGVEVVSDAVRATLYRALRGKVGNCGAYVRRILDRGEVATPPPGLAPGYLTDPQDVFDAVRSAAPTDQLAKARNKLAARAAAAASVWSSLPPEDRESLDAELDAYLSTVTLLPAHRAEWAKVEMMEGLLAERGLLATLPQLELE